MTRERMYGSDTEFCNWMRSCPELPSYSKDFGFVASDNDVTVHRYMTSVDSVGTREVQGIMQIEVKTRQGKPSPSQMDTLSKLNLFEGHKIINGVYVNFFGVFLLILSGTNPDDSSEIWWGSIPSKRFFSNPMDIRWTLIDKQKLVRLLCFELHPINLTDKAFRRHHKTQEILAVEMTPLGFEVEKKLIKRS